MIKPATKTEVRLVQLAANEVSRRDMADMYGVDIRAIEKRFDRLREKHKCRGMIGLIMLFARNKLIK